MGASFHVWMLDVPPLVVVGGLLLLVRADTRAEPEPAAAAETRAWAVLRWVCVGFAAFAVVVALGSHTLPFELYRQAIADAWFRGTLDAAAWSWLRFTHALVGATFLAHFLVLAVALRRAPGERWVLGAVATSMLAWFVVDAAASLVHGAAFNVWMIDVPSLLAVAVPWWLAHRHLGRDGG